jgi:DNA replication protein DnaC
MSDEFDEARDEVRRAWEAENERRRQTWRAKIVPPRYVDACLAEVHEQVREQLTDWVMAESSTNVVLMGPVGVGKTFAAIATAYGRWLRGESVVYTSSPEMLDDLRPRNDGDPRTYSECDVLVLDDLGRAKSSDWTHERQWSILDRRSSFQRPTIATTNARDLDGILDEASVSRLLDGALVLRMNGRDRRVAR